MDSTSHTSRTINFTPFAKGQWHQQGYVIQYLEPDPDYTPLTRAIRRLPTRNTGSLNLHSAHYKQRLVEQHNPSPLTRVCKELPSHTPARTASKKELERELVDAYLFDQQKTRFKHKRAARLAATPV